MVDEIRQDINLDYLFLMCLNFKAELRTSYKLLFFCPFPINLPVGHQSGLRMHKFKFFIVNCSNQGGKVHRRPYDGKEACFHRKMPSCRKRAANVGRKSRDQILDNRVRNKVSDQLDYSFILIHCFFLLISEESNRNS